MKDQVHIRNAEAAGLARALARQTGKSISTVALEALRQYRPAGGGSGSRGRRSSIDREIERWGKLLRIDRQGLARTATPIEAFYDDATALPK
jgi:hypothetical protein